MKSLPCGYQWSIWVPDQSSSGVEWPDVWEDGLGWAGGGDAVEEGELGHDEQGEACHPSQYGQPELKDMFGSSMTLEQKYYASQVRPPGSTQLGFELMTSKSWQYIPCHWDASKA